VLLLSLVYVVLAVAFVRPYLWPAGHGVAAGDDSRFTGGSGDRAMLVGRPPQLWDDPTGVAVVRTVDPDSPAARAGLQSGDEVRTVQPPHGETIDLSRLATADPIEQLQIWRSVYWMGLRGPVTLTVLPTRERVERTLQLERPPVWQAPRIAREWAQHHLGMMVQMLVFIAAAAVLLFLRSDDVTATLAVSAFALCAIGGGGPLMGSEAILPVGLRELMTVFAWIGVPLAFIVTGLAIEYFPRRSPMLGRHPWLHAVPFLAAAPMLVMGLGTALFLTGVDGLAGAAVWDSTHPLVYYASFAAALAVNVAAIFEGFWRYQRIEDPNERRRISIAVWTTMPGVLAFAIKDGVPAVAALITGREIHLPWSVTAVLQAFVLLPAFGLTYAVAVHRVLAPRVVVRRSIQYALANNTIRVAGLLPAAALTWALVSQRGMTLGEIVSGAPLFYMFAIGASIAAFKYRDRARTWLDQRFFREEYDARKILLSLASRVRFESDPSDLTTIVLAEIDMALHPEMSAILISGLDEGRFTPVNVLHGSAESLPIDGGLAAMLRWSDEPLEIYLDDPRSPARRLPPAEQEWLECTGAALLVPILGDERALIGIIVLGGKRSEETYTAEDRQLLASIATQVGLGLDVARLRRRLTDSAGDETIGLATPRSALAAMMECPRCGRCEDAGTKVCPSDGAPMSEVPSVPKVVDGKYRIEQLLGRGGMGAVYRAHDIRLDRDIAIKVVRADFLAHGDARRRFRREAQIVARLQHPAIVSIFDYGTFPDGGAYLVMELIRGEDLRRTLKREGRFPPDRTATLMSAICAAIETAHKEGVLHRDLKPENILLPGGGTDVKVLDFGVAKLIQAEPDADRNPATMVTVEGGVVGTPAYMAPEQLKGLSVDTRTDVFSLGVMAYEMLSGELPFGAASVADIALRQIQGPPPIRLPDPLPSALEDAIHSALRLDPDGRPSSALAFAAAIGSALSGGFRG
jgi:hypothetical protein